MKRRREDPRRVGRSEMKRTGLVALVVIALSSAALAASKEKVSGAKAEILRLDAEWAKAAEAGDLEKTLAYWSDDASVFPPGSPALVGKDAIRAYVAGSLRTRGFRISWKTNEVTVAESGDLAYGVGTNRVSFTGPLVGPDLAERYAAADLLVLASRGETYGMVVSEALARGVPVLATDAGGLSEALGYAVGGRPGMLVPPDHPEALAEALRRWLSDSDLRTRLTEDHRARDHRPIATALESARNRQCGTSPVDLR